MKLEPNMYVRMASGRIAKIVSIEDDIIEFDDWIISTYGDYLDSLILDSPYLKQIKKVSHNIIDLIEVGDYVNGGKVSRIENDYIVINEIWTGRELLNNEDIKTILTKEQFENYCFRIGE